MKRLILLFSLLLLSFSGCTASAYKNIKSGPSTPLVEAARNQIGVVTQYDTGYYDGGYPPPDRGACIDVIVQALRDTGYDLKKKIDADIAKNPKRYPNVSDSNINFRRVQNVKVFLDTFATSLPTRTDNADFQAGNWQAGDLVTFDQIPGGLWHIAIISNTTYENPDGSGTRIPFLVHNHGQGTVEDDYLLAWPAPISGHYRIKSEI